MMLITGATFAAIALANGCVVVDALRRRRMDDARLFAMLFVGSVLIAALYIGKGIG